MSDWAREVMADASGLWAPKHVLPKAVMPSGLCPRCNRPMDDHTWDAKGPLCPKVTA